MIRWLKKTETIPRWALISLLICWLTLALSDVAWIWVALGG